jgi:uncharacterized protein
VNTVLNVSDWLFVAAWLGALAATFIPIVPAGFIIGLAAFIHQAFTGFSDISTGLWIGLAVLMLASSLADNIAGVIGAKHYGGSKTGVWGAFIGSITGIFIPFGIFFMPLVGAFAGELVAGRSQSEALKGAWGAIVGMLVGILGKFLIHLLMGILVIGAIF